MINQSDLASAHRRIYERSRARFLFMNTLYRLKLCPSKTSYDAWVEWAVVVHEQMQVDDVWGYTTTP